VSAENRARPDLQGLKVRLDRPERPASRACRALRVSAENRDRPDPQDPKVRLDCKDRLERPAHPECLALRASVAR
jgi:hypothetical protein